MVRRRRGGGGPGGGGRGRARGACMFMWHVHAYACACMGCRSAELRGGGRCTNEWGWEQTGRRAAELVGPCCHLDGNIDTLVCRSSIDLSEGRGGDGLLGDRREEGLARRVARARADSRRDRPAVAERLLDHSPRQAVGIRHVGRLKSLEASGRLVAHQVRSLRERLAHLDTHRPE